MDAALGLPVLVGLIAVALLFDFLNGLHDAANSIATIVSTRVLRPQFAVLWAAFFNFVAFLVFGLLLSFGMLFPNRIIVPLIPPIPMKAKVFVAIYGGLELFFGVTGTASGIAHFAHLGGMLGGFLMIRYWRGQPPFGGRGGRRF